LLEPVGAGLSDLLEVVFKRERDVKDDTEKLDFLSISKVRVAKMELGTPDFIAWPVGKKNDLALLGRDGHTVLRAPLVHSIKTSLDHGCSSLEVTVACPHSSVVRKEAILELRNVVEPTDQGVNINDEEERA